MAVYRRRYVVAKGFVLKAGHRYSRSTRLLLDLNPSLPCHRRLLRQLLGMFDPASARITRIDCAFDVHGVSIDELQAVPLSGRRARVLYVKNGDRLETVYIGARKSPRQIRLYDKQQQLVAVKGVSWQMPWIRLEAQVRNPRPDGGSQGGRERMGLHELDRVQNPLRDLVWVHLSAEGLSSWQAAMVEAAKQVSLARLRAHLPPEAFNELVNALRSAPSFQLQEPSELFERVGRRAARRFVLGLGLSPPPTPIRGARTSPCAGTGAPLHAQAAGNPVPSTDDDPASSAQNSAAALGGRRRPPRRAGGTSPDTSKETGAGHDAR